MVNRGGKGKPQAEEEFLLGLLHCGQRTVTGRPREGGSCSNWSKNFMGRDFQFVLKQFWQTSGTGGETEHYLQCVVGVGAADLNS